MDSPADTAAGSGRLPPGESEEALAHLIPAQGDDGARSQPLKDHLHAVGDLAAEFAAPFGAEDWGRLAGYWHDLGKYSHAFQTYLRAATSPDPHQAEAAIRVDHSTAGAQHAVASHGVLGHLLAFPISGHHSGLLDSVSDRACLGERLRKTVEDWRSAPQAILDQSRPKPPAFLRAAIGDRDHFAVAFFVRMLFSCLVDADFLDTEAFMSEERSGKRPEWPQDTLVLMSRALEDHLDRLGSESSEVNRQRDLVLRACLQAAERRPGLFSLTVPTGGGKTLSSLAFALKHAVRHGLRRIVYVVPFTSIIEQNADVFRRVMAPLVESGLPDPVIEHHSNLDPDKESTRSRLATENWDAPLMVTTGVQFYESLFGNRTSRCRKLHNLAQAVVILDEAQALPVDFLSPCLRALDELRRNYGTTVVLCTATQPAIQYRDEFPIGLKLDPGHEIIPAPDRLFGALKRVHIQRAGILQDEELAARILDEDRVLCIVNTRKHALHLADLLGESNGHFHLSALMCPQHRSSQLEKIRARLSSGRTCRVVSTRLIEAGVDIDFPVVYRSVAGLDSIAQAAGRCNRNGRLPVGRTVVFEPEDTSAERFLADTSSNARQVLALHNDPLSLEAVEHYFRLYYWDQSSRWDSKGILNEFRLDQNPKLPFLFGFATVAERFRLIDDAGKPVLVPWGNEGRALCDELRRPWFRPTVQVHRRLQRFTVQVPVNVWRKHMTRAFEIVQDRYAILSFPEVHYSERTGLRLDVDPAGVFIA